MHVFAKLSLTSRLTLIVFATLLPLVVLMALDHLEERDQKREEGLREATSYTQQIANALVSFASDLDSFMEAAALVLGSRDEPLTQANASTQLGKLYSRYEQRPPEGGETTNLLTALFITDLQGRVVAQASGDDIGFDVSSRPYIQALQAGQETIWTGGLSGLRSGEVTAAYGRVIRSNQGEPKGYLIAAIRPSNVSQRPPSLPKDANLFLADSHDQVVLSLRDPNLQSTPRDLSGWDKLSAARQSGLALVEAETTPLDSGDRYGAVAFIPDMGWSVGYTRSQAALEASLNNALLRDFGVLSGVIIVTLGALVLAARQVLRPVRYLAAAATRIAAGERVDVSVTGADPDVAKLLRAFETMSVAVAEREDRLREQARLLQTLDEVGAWIASDLDFQKTIQAVTDAGTRVTEAQYGAFFYNVAEAGRDEDFHLYVFSGVDGSEPAGFPLPRNAPIYEPTFRGVPVVRLADVTQDERFASSLGDAASRDGSSAVRSYLAVPVKSGNGSVIGGLFFCHRRPGAFTERHERLAAGIASWAAIALDNARLYAEAQEVLEDLRRSNRAKDEFLGLVSHELRTPTTTVFGGIRTLETRRQAMTPDMVDELVHSMSEEASRLVRLIENLLTFARLELGQEVERIAIDVNAQTRASLGNPGRLRAGRSIVQDLEQDLPPILAEPVSFEQVLLNLVSNADLYSPIDQPIVVQTRFKDSEVQVLVMDRGPGVKEEETQLIFESFYRSEQTSELASGQGLGLAVCKRLVERQSGRIWAENRPDGGLLVAFAFPAVRPPAEPRPGSDGLRAVGP